MRKTKKCPKCECKKLLAIAEVADQGDGGTSPRQARLAIRHEGYSFVGNVKTRPVGNLEAVVCSDCGYTEFYCSDAKTIEPDGKLISWL